MRQLRDYEHVFDGQPCGNNGLSQFREVVLICFPNLTDNTVDMPSMSAYHENHRLHRGGCHYSEDPETPGIVGDPITLTAA